MRNLLLISLLLFLYSCHSKPESTIMVWNYDDFIKKDVKMSDIADEMAIIQPDSIDYKGARIVHASSFFLAGTEQGILKYNNQGHFIGRIGSIGQGPGEYSGFYAMAINETERIIYVYRMNTSELLSFSYEGTFLNKHSLQLPKKWAWSFYYLKDKFYFYYCVDADNESQSYMYAITDTMGNLLSSKRDESLHFASGSYPSFPSDHIGLFGDTMLVWNQYSDTIYRVSEKGEEAFAVWGEWDKRLTPAKVEKEECNQSMIISTIFETINYYLCIWRPYGIKKNRWNYCFYDKASGKFFNSEGITDDLWGLPVFSPYNYFVIDGREYLEAPYQPYKLLDAWLSSDDPQIRKQAESIDEEGNNVLIRIRLKKNNINF
ncbi:6-bladed beta-propeller [uncultured Bacteroides sp.]|uniref:6-bladed beta-propeller n=1 Tax=uncultured Bacteroides sp. TaxID=162156 RepID=UPI0025F0F548|nr:6-bladed beta-propeller [uncultured Bacteroides sp.]